MADFCLCPLCPTLFLFLLKQKVPETSVFQHETANRGLKALFSGDLASVFIYWTGPQSVRFLAPLTLTDVYLSPSKGKPFKYFSAGCCKQRAKYSVYVIYALYPVMRNVDVTKASFFLPLRLTCGSSSFQQQWWLFDEDRRPNDLPQGQMPEDLRPLCLSCQSLSL